MASNKVNIKSVDDLLEKLAAAIEEKKQNRVPQTVAEVMPHIVDKIKDMRSAGFTDREICDTLASVGVEISLGSIKTYITRYGKKAVTRRPSPAKKPSSENSDATPETTPKVAPAAPAQAQKKTFTPSSPIINNPAPLDDA